MLGITFSHFWCPLSVCQVSTSWPVGKVEGEVSSLLEVVAVTQRKIMVHLSLVSQ